MYYYRFVARRENRIYYGKQFTGENSCCFLVAWLAVSVRILLLMLLLSLLSSSWCRAWGGNSETNCTRRREKGNHEVTPPRAKFAAVVWMSIAWRSRPDYIIDRQWGPRPPALGSVVDGPPPPPWTCGRRGRILGWRHVCVCVWKISSSEGLNLNPVFV